MAGISGLKIAILVTDGFEQVELTEPRKALDEAGADTSIVSPKTVRSAAGSSRNGVTACLSTCP